MRFLVVGLGSMGRRRIRNLQALGHEEIAGFDPREDRRAEAYGKYGIAAYDSFEAALAEARPTALIISTDPAHHMDYALPAAERNIHCFIEASVVDIHRIAEVERQVRGTGLVIAPSCTMRYFPAPRLIRDLIASGRIGRPLNLNYHVGQYLPDWHPWEDIRDFYVSRRETGGARELLPFELTWLNSVFGRPTPLACVKTKLTDIDADIDDIYHCILRYPNGLLASLTIDVVSRPRPTRELHIMGGEGLLAFSGLDNCVRSIAVGEADWSVACATQGTVEAGYVNPEEPYVAEVADFIRAVEASNASMFPNTLEDDIAVLRLVQDLEAMSDTNA